VAVIVTIRDQQRIRERSRKNGTKTKLLPVTSRAGDGKEFGICEVSIACPSEAAAKIMAHILALRA